MNCVLRSLPPCELVLVIQCHTFGLSCALEAGTCCRSGTGVSVVPTVAFLPEEDWTREGLFHTRLAPGRTLWGGKGVPLARTLEIIPLRGLGYPLNAKGTQVTRRNEQTGVCNRGWEGCSDLTRPRLRLQRQCENVGLGGLDLSFLLVHSKVFFQ